MTSSCSKLFIYTPNPEKTSCSAPQSRPAHLIAVLVVLEARVVVHEAIQFLEALVLLLRLQRATARHRVTGRGILSRLRRWLRGPPWSGALTLFSSQSLQVCAVPYLFCHLLGLLLHLLDDFVACAAVVAACRRAVLFPFLQADPAKIIFALRGDRGN